MTIEAQLHDAILEGDAPRAQNLTAEALRQKVEPLTIVNIGMIPALEETGRRFAAGQYFVPDLLIRARAMKTAMALVRPLLAGTSANFLGRAVIGTVKGDMHDIGKNLVGAMLEGSGFEVVDLGSNVSPEKFVDSIGQHQAQIVGISALLTTTMIGMKDVIRAIVVAGLRTRVKILVGGAPVTREFAQEIGADGTSNNAMGAVTVAKQVLGLPTSANAVGAFICT
jgi:methanogenic corrinoid protein MtbC1